MSRIPEFLEALEKMRKVHEAKNEDYASSDNPFSNFDASTYGLSLFDAKRDQSFVWPIFTKLARLATLLKGGRIPNNESIEDTFIDIANYTLLWRSDYIRRKNEEPVRVIAKDHLERREQERLEVESVINNLPDIFQCRNCRTKFTYFPYISGNFNNDRSTYVCKYYCSPACIRASSD